MKKIIKAIFFDLDDTLYGVTEFSDKANLNALKAMIKIGLNVPLEDLYKELKEILSEFASNYNYHFNKLLLRFPEETYKGINKSFLIANAVLSYHNTKYTDLKPYPDAINLLNQLKKYNIIKGIITAGIDIKQAEKILRLGIYEYISPEAIFISDQIGISKPNPKLYLHACHACKVLPQESIYVGDNPIKDIDPSNQIGMTSIRIRRNGKYSNLDGETPANYEISHFKQLEEILNKNFIFK